jgi:transposase
VSRCAVGRHETIDARLDAIFWIARTGAPCRDLPEELGN